MATSLPLGGAGACSSCCGDALIELEPEVWLLLLLESKNETEFTREGSKEGASATQGAGGKAGGGKQGGAIRGKTARGREGRRADAEGEEDGEEEDEEEDEEDEEDEDDEEDGGEEAGREARAGADRAAPPCREREGAEGEEGSQ